MQLCFVWHWEVGAKYEFFRPDTHNQFLGEQFSNFIWISSCIDVNVWVLFSNHKRFIVPKRAQVRKYNFKVGEFVGNIID